ncbi:hypothetical protein GGF46_000113 [Coemansia sp. RSA 552]|nr:hypothetical protein GGF46_000113 [Coemansia sp. RSA 552]
MAGGLRHTIAAVIILIILATVSQHAARNRLPDDSDGDEIIYDPDAPTYILRTGALNSAQVPFSNHSDSRPLGSYLQQTLDFAPFRDLFDRLNTSNGALQTRGEAHVTVISPPEFDKVLKPAGVTIKEIEDIARQADIQRARLAPVCLGRFSGPLPDPTTAADNGTFTLFSLVVADPFNDLLRIRRQVSRLYREKGGQGALFQPERFWPHVTIGFDRRDLFVEDGIFKGANYCYAPVHIGPSE